MDDRFVAIAAGLELIQRPARGCLSFVAETKAVDASDSLTSELRLNESRNMNRLEYFYKELLRR